jgi:excinuclease ABC subunit A
MPTTKKRAQDRKVGTTNDTQWISIRSARTHNLKDISIDLPRNQLVVITGISGSGKSSLAFDTLFAEGQRQYIESLSIYARQFVDQLERPDVDSIEGLQPSLCIDQRQSATNPRSTVGTITEVYDYLRLLFARCGSPACPNCGNPIDQQPREQIEKAILALPEGTRVLVMAPMVRGRQGKHADVFAKIRKAGLVRLRVDGEQHEIDSLPELALRKRHTVEAIVDRLVIRDASQERVVDAVDLALRLTEGLVQISYLLPGESRSAANPSDWMERTFSTLYACADCGISMEELEPRTFSFNSPYGCCPVCEGVGKQDSWDGEAMIPDWSFSASEGGIVPWRLAPTPTLKRNLKRDLEPLLERMGIDWKTPLNKLGAVDQRALIGSLESQTGLIESLQKIVDSSAADRTDVDQWLNDFRGLHPCPECDGSRIHAAARAVKFSDRSIDQLCALDISSVYQWFVDLPPGTHNQEIAGPILQEMQHRLKFLDHVGVGYLTLGRDGDSLSGGELQRVRLASSIGSGLVGVCYVLDEPSIGLHQRDNDVLIDSIRELQRQGNSIIVVEHDEAMMKAADWLVDMGPGAGKNGGKIVAEGTPAQVMATKNSLTGRYLTGAETIAVPNVRRKPDPKNQLAMRGVRTQNLQNIDVDFPLGCLIGISGVSGSGKSSLINQTLAPAIRRHLGLVGSRPGPYRQITGLEHIDKLIQIDQRPIGRSPRSTPATYCGVFDEIRKVFTKTRDAKQRGFAANRFSFNAGDGRCPGCQGQGQQKIEMNFLADIYVPCSQCNGRRFNRQTLHVRFKGANIADVLAMSIQEAAEFFKNVEKAYRQLDSLCKVGLGYLSLGQPSNTLSGGESQRIKLASELSKRSTGKTIYLLDEPTTGLHTDDIRRLIDVLQRIVDSGNTVIVIEHNLDVLKCCDWLIDLGPDGGSAGGELLVSGTPERVAETESSITGRFLRTYLPE